MAEVEEKKEIWPGGFPEAKSVEDFDFLMTGKNGGPITKIPKSRLSEVIGVVGESMPAIQGGATAATAVALPAGPTGYNRFFDASSGYWKYNNVVLKNPLGTDGIPEGNDGVLYWSGTATTPTWKISKMQLLPVTEGTDQVIPDGIKLVNQKGVYNAVSPVNALVTGGNIPFGIMQNISTYNVADTSEFVEVNLRKASPKKGKVKRVNIFVSKVGDIKVAAFKDESPTGATLATLRNMQEFLLTCSIVGLNTFVDGTHFNNFSIETGWLAGVRKVAGGALPTRITLATGTKGCARLASTTSPAVGNAGNMGIHPMEFAIEFEVDYIGIDSDLSTMNKKVGTLENNLSTAVFKSDFSLVYGNNIFNPNTRVVDRYIDSAGNIQIAAPGSGWEMAWIDVSMFKAGDQFTLGPMVISSGHSAWYTDDVRDGYAGGYSTGTLPKVYTYPSGISPKKLGFVTQRGGVTNTNIMFNVGSVALPFEEYQSPKINGIGDLEIQGANSGDGAKSDQELYKTSSVQFAFITAAGMAFPIEVWDEVAQTDILSGQFYAFDAGNPNSYQIRMKK